MQKSLYLQACYDLHAKHISLLKCRRETGAVCSTVAQAPRQACAVQLFWAMRQWRGGGRQADPASHACVAQPRKRFRRTKPKNAASKGHLQIRTGPVFEVTAPATQVVHVRLTDGSSTAPDFQYGRIQAAIRKARRHTLRCAAQPACTTVLLPPAAAAAACCHRCRCHLVALPVSTA